MNTYSLDILEELFDLVFTLTIVTNFRTRYVSVILVTCTYLMSIYYDSFFLLTNNYKPSVIVLSDLLNELLLNRNILFFIVICQFFTL